MAYYPPCKQTTMTPDFVVDLLSPLNPPPKPSRQFMTSSNPADSNRRTTPEVNSMGRLRQAPPPCDDDQLVLNVQRNSIESFETGEVDDNVSYREVRERIGSTTEYSSASIKRSVMPPSDDFDAVTVIRPSSTLISCGDELLLASVPYHTLRIEPSPAVTLDYRKNARRSRCYEADGQCMGRLKSTGSVDNDLESMRDIIQPSEPVRSSSTPLLTDSEQSAFYANKSSVVDKSMVQKLNMFFGESKETATELEANIYTSLVMGPLPKADDTSIASSKSKKSGSAWSLATKFQGSHVSLAGKQKKSSEDKAAAESTSQAGFQKTKERRSLRGRVALFVRQGVGALSSGSGDTTVSSLQGPKTFGIPLDQCYMSNNYEGVPRIVDVCISIINEQGLDCQGIYRVPGNAGVVHELQEQLDKSPQMHVEGELWREVNVVGSLLKLFFRKLPESLLPPDLYDRLIESNRLESHDDRFYKLKDLLEELPDYNYMTLRFLMEHLSNVASQHHLNKMDAYNLAIMFGPALVRPRDDSMVNMLRDMADQGQIVEKLIKHCDWFFDQSQRELSVPPDTKADSTSPQLLPNAENLVELQVVRDTQARELVASFEQFQAANAGSKTRGKTRKRSKSLKDNGDSVLASDSSLTKRDNPQPVVKAKLKEAKSSSNLETLGSGTAASLKSSHSGRRNLTVNKSDIQLVATHSERRQLSVNDDDDANETLVDIVRYPARRFDTNTFYVGPEPSTLVKNSTKSASAECLETVSQPLESALDMIQHAATLQIKPRAKPPVPPKPKSAVAAPESEKSVDEQHTTVDSFPKHSERTGNIDPKFKEELSSALKSRYDIGKKS